MTTANKLTIMRIVLVPVYIILILVFESKIPALIVFIIASLTDLLDGQIARRRNQITDFGKFMDPLADKLLVTSALLLFIQFGQMPAWAVMVIIAREFAVSGLRMVAAASGDVIAAAWSGKIKTAASIVCICIMMTPLCPAGSVLNLICIAVMVISTVVSGVEYFWKNGAILLKKE
ncbi:MAG: CDP-diacylglycerol--glycerol-3-phosphate 3-phosphatidyltransferase [Oscillospiraceae bacterium]|nr:CDP-diacylglycerol--glycerol-3-phosphate 3-phosphatidyltransferase [Oscillospiraceae bacterium]